MIELAKEIDFSKEIEDQPQMRLFYLEAAKKVEQEEAESLQRIRKPEIDEDLQNHFIISGIPTLTPENVDKFQKVFRAKLLDAKKIGAANGLERCEINIGKGNGTQTIYMVYRTVAETKVAFHKLNHLKFDKNCTLCCFTIREIQEVLDFKEELKIPETVETKQKISYNFDEQNRNQFLVRETNNIHLNWLDHLDHSSLNALPYESLAIPQTVNKVVFSYLGNYMAVCTQYGIGLYVGSQMKMKVFLKQEKPINVKFSSNEKYMISSNGGLIGSRENVIIWAVEEEFKIKSYKTYGPQNALDLFQFSDDSSHLAVITSTEVLFYDVSTIENFKKHLKSGEEQANSLKVTHAQHVAWLKNNTTVVCVCYQLDYDPKSKASTRIIMYNVVEKVERKWRAWNQHAKCGEIIVSEKGTWVTVVLKKFIKRNHFATVVQIGNLIKKDEQLEVTSLEIKDELGNISWDDRNDRFAVISQDETTKKGVNVRFNTTFYELVTHDRTIEIVKIHEMQNILQNRVHLVKNGAFFALYNISNDSPEKGKFSFGYIAKEKDRRKYTVDFLKQNVMLNGMSFFSADPSGRFVLMGTEKSYQVWSFIGEILCKDTMQKSIADLQWRPRLQNTLNEKEERSLVEQEKEIRKKYEELDFKRTNQLQYEKQETRKKQKKDFMEYINAKKKWFMNQVDKREKRIGFKASQVRTEYYDVEESVIELQ